MKTHKESFAPAKDFVPAFGFTSVGDGDLAVFAQRMKDISRAADTLRQQLAEYEATAENEDLHDCAEALRTWMDINREGLAVAAHVAELGTAWAEEMSARLETATQGLRDAAGGQALADGLDKGLQLSRVWKEINDVLDSMEALYKPLHPRGEIEKVVDSVNAYAR